MRRDKPAELGIKVLAAVEAYAKRSRFGDDLTILLLRRAACRVVPSPARIIPVRPDSQSGAIEPNCLYRR